MLVFFISTTCYLWSICDQSVQIALNCRVINPTCRQTLYNPMPWCMSGFQVCQTQSQCQPSSGSSWCLVVVAVAQYGGALYIECINLFNLLFFSIFLSRKTNGRQCRAGRKSRSCDNREIGFSKVCQGMAEKWTSVWCCLPMSSQTATNKTIWAEKWYCYGTRLRCSDFPKALQD